MKEPRLLESLAEVDAEWLNAVMHNAGYHEATVESFSIVPIGAGNVSDTARILLDVAENAAEPASIVCKFRPSNPALHAHGIGSGAYHRELGAYRLLSTVADGCRIPKLFWLDGSHDNINLVMEDLTQSTRPGDQIAGCGIVEAEAVIVELARLHRGFFPMDEAAAPDWAVRMPLSGDYWVPALARAAPIIASHYAGRLSDADIALIAAAADVTRAWHDMPQPRATLTHGDPRVDNILFQDRYGGVDAIVIDWQVVGRRNPMHDIGYFLSGSISVGDRRLHERRLLARYRDVFGAVQNYREEELLADYRVQLVSGLMTTAAAAALLPLTPAVDRLLLTLLERNCAAVADWDSIGAIRAQY